MNELHEVFSMYREMADGIIMYHNINERSGIDIPHLHSRYEIYYNIHGAKGILCDKKFYACTGNDLFIFPKAQIHKAIVDRGASYERCIISVDSGVIDAINAMPYISGRLAWLDCVGDSLPGKVNLSSAESKRFMQYIKQYNEEEDALFRLSLLLQVLSFAGSFFKAAKPTETHLPQTLPEKALLVVEENFRTIKTAEVAERLFMDDSYLSKLFKEEYGITLSNYLIVRKLAEAKKYLHMGVSVKEACYLSGFHNYSNFIRTFKKFEGTSPGNLTDLSDPL